MFCGGREEYVGHSGGSSNSVGRGNWLLYPPVMADVMHISIEDHRDLPLQFVLQPADIFWVMNFCTALSRPPSEQVLLYAETALQTWGLRFRVSESVVTRLVCCLDSTFLLSLPRPLGFKVSEFSPPQIHRYLWYRQAAKALGWRDRQKFPSEIEALLKLLVWPDEAAEMCNATNTVECRNKPSTGSGDVARKGSSGKDRQGSTDTTELGSSRGNSTVGASCGSDTADPGIVDICWRGGKRSRECSPENLPQADGEDCTFESGSTDDLERGGDSKRARLQLQRARDSTA